MKQTYEKESRIENTQDIGKIGIEIRTTKRREKRYLRKSMCRLKIYAKRYIYMHQIRV